MSRFFAMMARMKYIERWGLMRSSRKENIQEHSLQTAMIAHMLALIGNRFFDKHYDADSIAVKAMYHESSEILTGDLPTPIKYYNAEIKTAYKAIESAATKQILDLLPEDFREDFLPILTVPDSEEKKLIKYADRLCAYLKCVEEVQTGNREFDDAMLSIKRDIDAISAPEVKYFTEHFVEAFTMTLDQLRGQV
ncbi:MAG: 5'-deoxynucleotidase [Clostridia bacterium]|nr:5'-deoxynucleotidase [Clostridia bacterium]